MPSVYGRVFIIGFYGQEFIAISMILRQRVYSNVHSRLSLTISHDFSSRYVYLFTAFNYEPLRALGACFLGSCSRLLAIQDVMAMFLLNFRPFRKLEIISHFYFKNQKQRSVSATPESEYFWENRAHLSNNPKFCRKNTVFCYKNKRVVFAGKRMS